MTPVLSVVVVARNAESYLSECLDSLRSQTLKRLEVLVVDDGSTDSTVEVARRVAAEDSRFRILMRPQLGVPASRNEGARLARGQVPGLRRCDRHRATECLCQSGRLVATYWFGFCSWQRTNRHPRKDARTGLGCADP